MKIFILFFPFILKKEMYTKIRYLFSINSIKFMYFEIDWKNEFKNLKQRIGIIEKN